MDQTHVQEALIDLLCSLPAFHRGDNRDALLFGLGTLAATIGRSSVAVADIIHIVETLGAVGQLTTGEWPLQILMRNAQRFCPANTGPGHQLKELLAQYEPSYDKHQLAQLPEIVIGTDERLPIAFLEKAIEAQRSVARLLVPRVQDGQPKGNPKEVVTGTGWMIGPGLLLTNHHVIEARFPEEPPASDSDMQAQASGAMAWFGYNSPTAGHFDYRCVQLLRTNKCLDYALLRIAESSLEGEVALSDWGRLAVAKAQPSFSKGTRLNIIQHPRGEEKRLAIRSNFYVGRTSTSEEPARIQYLTDTEPGASGSPVFDDNWQVVAMHHAAVRVPDSQYKGDVVKFNNQGIEIISIIEDLEETTRSQIGHSQGWN